MPGLEVARDLPRPRETVAAFLRRSGWATRDRKYGWQFRKGLPTVLEINGEAVLRKDWARRRIGASDAVRFVSYPLGGRGGAKQIIGLVALIAVSAFAFWAGPALAGALSLPGWAGSALTAGIGLGGDLNIDILEK
jgi:sulfur carrier protein ThiS